MENTVLYSALPSAQQNELRREFNATPDCRNHTAQFNKYTSILQVIRRIGVVLSIFGTVLCAIILVFLPEGWNYAVVALFLAVILGGAVYTIMIRVRYSKCIKQGDILFAKWLKEQKNIEYDQ